MKKRKICSHTTSVGNKRKQMKDIKYFVVSNIVSILSYPSRKADQNEVHLIKYLLQYSMPSAYRCKKEASKKSGHLIAQSHNKEVEWSVKPCIV